MSARKPMDLHTGHHTKAELEQMKQENDAAIAPQECFLSVPDALNGDVAENEWKRITKLLADMQIIGDLDMCNLIGYCNAYALYKKATLELADAPLVIETEKGTIKNPLIDIQDRYAKQMRDFSVKAGLAVDTRLKHAALKVKKEDDKDIADEFGDI